MGRRNTTAAVQNYLQQQSPRQVLSCGFAGGLDPQLSAGAVLFATTDATLAQSLETAGARRAQFVGVDRIATTAFEKRLLRETSGADAVEMESDAVHQLCAARGLPCATVRVISDPAPEDLPLDFNALTNPDQSLNFGKLALALAKSPGKIPALLRLRTNTRNAAQSLATVLARLL
jgi:adenosylhomocysteine nucleosidase